MGSSSVFWMTIRNMVKFVKSLFWERNTCSPRRCRHLPWPTRRKSRILASCIIVTLTLVFLQFRFAIYESIYLERDFSAEFSYISDFDDFPGVTSAFKKHVESTNNYSNFFPAPLNLIFSEIRYLTEVRSISNTSVGLLIIVKSAAHNIKKRNVIRKTWGNSDYLLQTNVSPDLPTKIAFILGTSIHDNDTQSILESKRHGDIVLAEFIDTYDNNTFKTILALRWAIKVVKNFKYLMFLDDDMYLSPSNVISFIQNITKTNVILMESNLTGVNFHSVGHFDKYRTVYSLNKHLPLRSQPLMMGDVNTDAAPFRNIIGSGSKWSISIDEYAYNYFPPYVAGGATLFDNSMVAHLYYGSFFTKLCKIDDVYLGIIAYKLGLQLTHSSFMDSSYVDNLKERLNYKFDKMLTFHGLLCPEQLEEVWLSRSLNFTFYC